MKPERSSAKFVSAQPIANILLLVSRPLRNKWPVGRMLFRGTSEFSKTETPHRRAAR
jgi:hypothetical protein